MIRKQLLTVATIMIAILVAILFVTRGEVLLALPRPDGADAGSRLAFVAKWMLVPGLCLFAGIVLVMGRRFISPDAFDGTRLPQSQGLEINLRFNQNTVEQTVLAGIAWTGLALTLPSNNLSLIPALAILFGAGRVLFLIGYLITPWARALGFGFSFYPTAAALLWLTARAFL